MFNTCTTPLNHVAATRPHCPTLSVSKNIFQLRVKRCWCFYNLCLGLLRENMGDELSSALPSTYFFPLVSIHPTPILLPLFFIYLLYIYFSLFLTSCLSMPSPYLYIQTIIHFVFFWEDVSLSFCKFQRWMPIKSQPKHLKFAKILPSCIACLSKFRTKRTHWWNSHIFFGRNVIFIFFLGGWMMRWEWERQRF